MRPHCITRDSTRDRPGRWEVARDVRVLTEDAWRGQRGVQRRLSCKTKLPAPEWPCHTGRVPEKCPPALPAPGRWAASRPPRQPQQALLPLSCCSPLTS